MQKPIMVVRTWKRDRSRNVMQWTAAIENLADNCVETTNRNEISELLLEGQTLSTPNATFHVPGITPVVARTPALAAR